MPNVKMTLPDIAQSVSRPIVFDVIHQLQEITKIDTSAKIFFPGDIEHMQQSGSSLDTKSRDALFGSDRIVFIEVEENFDVGAIQTTGVYQREHLPIFKDDLLGVRMTPVYATSDIVINVKYRTESKTEAQRWIDDMRISLSQLRDINLHQFTYHYLIPEAYLNILEGIHTAREAVAGYGQTFDEYLVSNATSRLTTIGDLVNKDRRLAVSETQGRVIGTYAFDGVPDKKEREGATATYVVSFSYKFSYERPAACELLYPIIVHNQLLPKALIDFNKEALNPTQPALSFTRSLEALNYFEQSSVHLRYSQPQYTIHLPSYDEFIPSNVQFGTGTIFFALCTKDNPQSNELLNLNELGDLVLDADILTFLRESEYQYMTQLYQSVVQISLYRGEHLAGNEGLVCDRELRLSTLADIDLRTVHHIRFSLITDLTLLKEEAIARLRKYPKALAKIIEALNELLANHPRLSALRGKNMVTAVDFAPFYRFLTGMDYKGLPTPRDYFGPIRGQQLETLRNTSRQRKTVQVSSVIASRLTV